MTDEEVVTDDTGVDTLSDVFDDSSEPEAKAEAEPEEKGETEAKAEDETTEATAEEVKEEPPASEQKVGQLAALMAERDKRKKAEAELQALREKTGEVEKPIDPVDDPEGYAEGLRSESRQAALQDRLSLSRDLMMEVRDDYTEKEQVFMGMIKDADGNIVNEHLLQQLLSSSNPAKFAYEQGKKEMRVQQLSDPKYEETLKAKIREELLAELKTEGDKLSAQDVPDLTGSGAGSKEPPAKIPTIDEIFADT